MEGNASFVLRKDERNEKVKSKRMESIDWTKGIAILIAIIVLILILLR